MPSKLRFQSVLRMAFGSVVVGLMLNATLASAQVPDEFTNLKVLPEDIDKAELLETMKGFALGLGVRCTHCHVGEEGAPLETFDFASDDKANKRVARRMLAMVQEINQDVLPHLEERGEPAIEVQCVTCHRGQARPMLTSQALDWAYQQGGVDALQARYQELRDQYYGTHTYDFSERSLLSVAESLAARAHNDDAVRVTELVIKHYPRSFEAWFTQGQLQARTGDLAAAIASLEHALTLNQHPFVQQRLEALREQLSGTQENADH